MRHHQAPLPFLILFLSSTICSTSFAQCLLGQRSALLHLKQGFIFSKRSISILSSWNPSTDCCNWEGVSCHDSNSGLVTELDLSNLYISGNLDSSALFNLTALVSLNLAHNYFNWDPFPPSWGIESLVHLTRLNLSNSGFTGQVPAGISHLTRLVSLDLSTFYMEETPKHSLTLQDPDLRTLIRDLGDLTELYLDGVNISANGTEWCGAVSSSVPNIQELSLQSCSISGPIDDSLAGLQFLSVLRLDGNPLNSPVPDFIDNFTSLSQLSLSSCGLRAALPETIFKLGNLTLLDLSNNPSLSGFLPELPRNSPLVDLVVSNTNLSGNLPESIGVLKSLATLKLQNSQFSGWLPPTIGNLTQLLHLDLSFNNFSGEIPSLLSWERIMDIVLSNNNLSGPIPTSLGDLSLQNLTNLDLQNNQLSGPIPASLFSLPWLRVLQLNQNQLSGELPEFQNASSMLETINLSQNNLQGQIPTSVFNVTTLKVLELSSNNFSGVMELGRFGSLRNLSSLDLSNNMLSLEDEAGASSLSFPMLGTLGLRACNLTRIPGFLIYQSDISYLDLSNNRISGSIPKWIWNIGNISLTYLNLSSNLFTDVERPLPELSIFSSPMILDLHSNMLQGSIPLPPTYTIVLDYSNNNFDSIIPLDISLYLNFTIIFSLSNNSVVGEIPPSICSVSNLQVLDLSNNKLSGLIPPCLMENNTRLSVLNLKENQLQGIIPQSLAQGCALQSIFLNGNQLEGKVPMTLNNCRMLEVLDLANNHFDDVFPLWLGNLPMLKVLILNSNRFYGTISHSPSVRSNASNYTFPKLQILDLSSNHFNGTLSPEFFADLKSMLRRSEASPPTTGFNYKLRFTDTSFYQDTVTIIFKGQEIAMVKILTILTCIDLSNNRLEGAVPHEIGGLTSLNMLNMSWNFFKGEIPQSLGGLMQLDSLDLSTNELSGEIPPELTNLVFLSILNLSNNDLVGKIPLANQFSTFSEDSFEGNQGLCGFPLQKQCSGPALAPSESRIEVVKPGRDPNWQFIFIGVGFGTGLAVVFGVQSLCEEWCHEIKRRRREV